MFICLKKINFLKEISMKRLLKDLIWAVKEVKGIYGELKGVGCIVARLLNQW